MSQIVDPEIGYHPDDQYVYSPAVVRELIPMALDGPETPTDTSWDSIRCPGDPAVGGNLLALIMDVKRVIAWLSVEARRGMFLRHLNGLEPEWVVVREVTDFLNHGRTGR